MPDLVGQRLAHFRINAKLGEGGMGVVYRATDEKLRREVALKVLLDEYAGSEGRRARFLREARSAAAATHACIATIHEIGEADGHPFIAMELIAGTTLRVRLARGLFVPESVRIGRDIARGLAKAHQSGVVHRDLKPENVMVTDEGDVKILDFGIAKLTAPDTGDLPPPSRSLEDAAGENVTAMGTLVGTVPYMSPEQARGEPTDARSDVFSLGTMLYEMLSGVNPFRVGKTIEQLYAVVLSEPTALDKVNPSVSPGLAAVVARCMAKDKEARFPSGAEVRAALEGFVTQGAMPESAASGPIVSSSGPKVATADGMGPGHASTLDSSGGPHLPPTMTAPPAVSRAAQEVAPAPVGAAPGGRSLARRGVFVAVGVFAVVGVAVVALRSTGKVPSPAPSASASAEPAAPPAETDAMRAYRQANGDLAAGDLAHAMAGWERAISKDPSLCEAHLRIAANQDAANVRAREELEKVRGCQDRLSPEDRALAGVVASFADPTLALSEKLLNATRAADAFPKSAEIAFYVASYLDADTTAASDGLRWIERLVAADPSFAGAYALRADQLRVVHHTDEARAALEACFAHKPDAPICADREFDLLAHDGECAKAEGYVRGLLARHPSAVFPYEMLSRLLLGTGAPADAVLALQQQADPLRPPEDAPSEAMKLRLARQLCIARGDFTCALDANARALALEAAHVDATVLWQYAQQGVRLWREAGKPEAARDVMKAFLGRLPASEMDETFLAEHVVQVSLVSFELGLAPWSKVAEASAKSFAAFPVSDPFDRWTAGGVSEDPTPEEARYTVKLAPPASVLEANRENVLDVPSRASRIGQNFLRAGSPALARPWLEQAAKACIWTWRSEPITPDKYDIQRVQAFLALGEARERTGDKAGAREAYGEVVRRWGDAKPRSVSAEKAKGRLKVLGR